MTLWERIVGKLLPWAPRSQRRQAITQARRDRIAAERRLDTARRAEARLRRVTADNHIAAAIAQALGGHRNGA